MKRADVARLALRAYPAGVRQAGDAEVISTLLEAGGASSRAFSRELVSVVVRGLLQRVMKAQRIRPSRLGANALAYGGLTLCVWLAAHSAYLASPSTGTRLWHAGFAAAVFLYGLGYRRSAGMIGIAALATLRLAGSFSSLDYVRAACQAASFWQWS